MMAGRDVSNALKLGMASRKGASASLGGDRAVVRMTHTWTSEPVGGVIAKNLHTCTAEKTTRRGEASQPTHASGGMRWAGAARRARTREDDGRGVGGQDETGNNPD